MAGTTEPTKAKAYKALTPEEAYDICARHLGTTWGQLSFGERMLYAETIMLHRRIDEIENQAQEMMSPDAMMDMATKFLGGGMPMG